MGNAVQDPELGERREVEGSGEANSEQEEEASVGMKGTSYFRRLDRKKGRT